MNYRLWLFIIVLLALACGPKSKTIEPTSVPEFERYEYDEIGFPEDEEIEEMEDLPEAGSLRRTDTAEPE